MNDKTENDDKPTWDGIETTEKPDIKIIKTIDTTNASILAHADALIETIPDVTESAINVHTEQQAEITESATGLVDKNGNAFDTSQHQVDSDGKPKISATGKLMLKRGRKAGVSSARPQSKVGTGATQPMQDSGQHGLNESQLMQAAITGKVTASLLINGSMMIGGQEFAPTIDARSKINEREALESAFTDYYVATGKVDIPPMAALVLTVGMYILPRFAMPTVQTKLKAKGGKIYTWWQTRKLKKQQKKAGKQTADINNGTQSNSGHDRERENNVGQETGAGLQN